jgi:1-acyl-sn-glycerol-3-phosphate acyltransferase
MANAQDAPRGEIAASSPAAQPGGVVAESVAPRPGASIFSFAGFNKLFAGSLCGTLADRLYQMSLIAAANVIFAGTASEEKVVWIQIVATVPGLLLYPMSGSLIDACDRRRLMTGIKASKIAAVLLLVPLLWHVATLNSGAAPADLKEKLIQYWPWCLAVVVLLNIISVPFSPARAAAVPDVAPEEQRSLGASLMATTGLISLLVGSMAGGYLARSDVLGPGKTILVSSAFYLFSTLFFMRLPDAVAVPGTKRGQPTPESDKLKTKASLSQYLAGIWEGVVYCFKHKAVLGLIFFETIFWTIGSAFYVLLLFHARTQLHLSADDMTLFFGVGLGCAGIGLFGGAIGIGKICGKTSPIATYPIAFLLIAAGLYGVFRSEPVDGHAPYWVYAVMFGLGLGGGMMLGRVDADVLSVTEERIRGRVFSIKSMAFAATILVTMLFITEAGLSDDQKHEITLWMPRAMFMLFPLVFILSWIVDIAIWSPRNDTDLGGPVHRFGYALCRGIFRLFAKFMFRYEVVGKEKIPTSGPLILAANHACFVDPLLLGSSTDRIVQWIMFSGYYRGIIHPVFRFLRCIPVDDASPRAALKAGIKTLDKGACIGIFPEGHVSDDGKLQPPQGGALFLAQRSGAPVLPVAIKGNYAAWPRKNYLPRFSKITLIVGEPFVVPKDLGKKETAALADKLMADLAKLLELEAPEKTADKIKDRSES